MPRGQTQENSKKPAAQVWVRKVEGSHRIRIPGELALVVNWIPTGGGSVDCVARVAAAGGLQILAKQWFDERFETLNRHLAMTPPLPEEAGAAWLPFVRSMATHWPCRLGSEAGRYTLTLPEEARLLGVAPAAEEAAVVFGLGDLLEIWRRDDWVAHVRGAARDEQTAFEQSLNAIVERTAD